jgi:hypothetical protein
MHMGDCSSELGLRNNEMNNSEVTDDKIKYTIVSLQAKKLDEDNPGGIIHLLPKNNIIENVANNFH